MQSGQVPNHLLAAAKAGFLNSIKEEQPLWQRIAAVHDMAGKTSDLVDLGATPMPVNGKTGITVQDFVERHLEVTPDDWNITVWISYNALQDDRSGILNQRVNGAARNFNRHFNKLVFSALNSGDGTTYGKAYDNQNFYSNSHIDSGAHYQTAQDNMYGLTLSMDNFETVRVAAQNVRDDQGEFLEYAHNLLVVPPALERTAANITSNPEDMGTANRQANPYSGKIDYVTSPYLDSTAWILAAATEIHKPIILAMRERPSLQSAWFDPESTDGGRYYFKFFARYNVFYGDWRLAFMGQT